MFMFVYYLMNWKIRETRRHSRDGDYSSAYQLSSTYIVITVSAIKILKTAKIIYVYSTLYQYYEELLAAPVISIKLMHDNIR